MTCPCCAGTMRDGRCAGTDSRRGCGYLADLDDDAPRMRTISDAAFERLFREQLMRYDAVFRRLAE